MAFESLSDRLQNALKKITGRGKLHESDIDDMLREVRLSLLEADVNFKVVKKFLKEVKEKAIGEKILNDFIEALSDVASPEKKPVLEGKNMFIILAKQCILLYHNNYSQLTDFANLILLYFTYTIKSQ